MLYITDCALRFKELGDADGKFQLIYNRLKLTGNCKVQADSKSSQRGVGKYHLSLIEIAIELVPGSTEKKSKNLIFVVQGQEAYAQRACERIKEEVGNDQSQNLRFLDQETLLKLDILSKKPHLRELFLE